MMDEADWRVVTLAAFIVVLLLAWATEPKPPRRH